MAAFCRFQCSLQFLKINMQIGIGIFIGIRGYFF